MSTHDELDRQLATLRDSPVDNAGASDAVLANIFTYLMEIPSSPSDGRLHWFCSRATPTTVAAATFLIRLFAYSSPLVEEWRRKVSCLSRRMSRMRSGTTRRESHFEEYREPPVDFIDGWPSDPVPPGILMLLAHENAGVRRWAEKQASRSKVIPISRDAFSASHVSALEALIVALDPEQTQLTTFPFAKTPLLLWQGFCVVLKLVPVEYLQTGHIYRVVNRHLHDIGSHSFQNLTSHVGRSFWSREGPEYPQINFDSIKENPWFSQLLLQHTTSFKEHPLLSWCSTYLSAIEGQPAQAEVLAKMADFLCEELQHERFGDSRPAIMLTALNLFSGLYQQKGFPLTAMSKVFDIHASVIVDVAFSKPYRAPAWSTARSAACQKQKVDENDVPLTGGPRLWGRAYQALQPSDCDGMAILVEIIAQLAHLDVLTPKPFLLSKFDQIGANRAMRMVWDGLRDTFTRFTESSRSTSLLDFLRRPKIVQHVFVLLLSPIADIQLSAQSLVGLAFDVDGRQDCYRALLENHADAALEGLFQALTTFTKYCDYGTRSIPHFLRPEDKSGPCSRLPALWNLMNQAITVIFKRTPMWANYFENEEMLLWMRDALIYGRDLLAQFRMHGAIQGRLSKIGQQMADDLQRVLPELTKWLRLSDEELLYQMFELLQSLLDTFHETRVPPLDASLQKMTKHIHDARNDKTKSRLDSSRLLRLENTLALFTPDEENIPTKTQHKTHPKGSSVPKEVKKLRKTEPSVDVQPLVRSGGKAKGDHFFTVRDQQHLDGVDSFPTYRRNAAAGPSKPRRPSVALTASTVHSSEAEEQSSEGENEEESQGAGTLASLSHMQREPKIRQPQIRQPHAPPRQIKIWEDPIEKNPIQLRLERRAQAAKKYQRLRPDLSPLYKTILSWDYHHDGAYPPGPQLKPTHVPADRFTDYSHYHQVFEPLLLLECWAQIQQSKEEIGESYSFKINARQFIDDWVDLDMTFNGSVKKDWRLTESDVVLLQQGASSVLGKVESYKTPMGKAIETKIRCVARLDPGLLLDTEGARIDHNPSLSTINREYAALKGLPHYELCSSILQPALPPIPTLDGEAVKKLSEHRRILFDSGVNKVPFNIVGPLLTLFKAARNSKPEAPTGPQILICAPSNAAIDEIAHRIRDSEAFRTKGKNVVRLGAVKSMNQNIVDISLDQLVDNKLDLGKDSGAAAELAGLRAELEAVKAQRKEKLLELDSISDNHARATLLQDEITRLNSKRTSLAKRYDEVKDNRIKESRGLDMSRRAYRLQVLQSADVICATLSGSGSDILQDLEIEMVVIDEASQAIELSALIPLKYQPKHSILVGDPQQLPPTVLSQEASIFHFIAASRFRYNESLFVRLQKNNPKSMHLLSIQYRMHPKISQLPSALFYQSRLKDGPDMAKKTEKPWHNDPKFGVYRFFDIKSVEEKSVRSIKNTSECQIAVALFARLRRAFASTDFDGQVGVISMYRAQIVELRRQFAQAFGTDVLQTVDFNTVDGFQGQEKSIIILSCLVLFSPKCSRPTGPFESLSRQRFKLPVPTAPSDLATPRDIKASIDGRASFVVQSPPSPPPNVPPPAPLAHMSDNLKRKLESDEPTSTKVRKPNVKPRPARPKDTSIFIPKKKDADDH
ncbi:AAA domain-containing protein [Mycena galericulata]|nr:AAA domain-containing protein [Mycena galericulata]